MDGIILCFTTSNNKHQREMKIIIERNQSEIQTPIVTIDTKTCHYPYAIRGAIELALEIDGYSKETINEVFGIMPDVEMKNRKEIQNKIDELQKNLDAVEKLLIKEEDAKVRGHYMQAKEDVQRDINTLKWVLRIALDTTPDNTEER
tara:strand:+ start:326 stop:766 length:441 start_codon:yes stop_codon:yes gene_type:complete